MQGVLVCTPSREKAAGSMSDYPIYCPAQTYASTRLEQAEYCMNEVFEEGELCGEHDAEARAEDDYDRYLQSKEEG